MSQADVPTVPELVRIAYTLFAQIDIKTLELPPDFAVGDPISAFRWDPSAVVDPSKITDLLDLKTGKQSQEACFAFLCLLMNHQSSSIQFGGTYNQIRSIIQRCEHRSTIKQMLNDGCVSMAMPNAVPRFVVTFEKFVIERKWHLLKHVLPRSLQPIAPCDTNPLERPQWIPKVLHEHYKIAHAKATVFFNGFQKYFPFTSNPVSMDDLCDDMELEMLHYYHGFVYCYLKGMTEIEKVLSSRHWAFVKGANDAVIFMSKRMV
jgi:hypothetical protein